MTEGVRKQIAALRRLATGRGTTEAEAMSAAAKAAELMQKHGLDETDIDFEEARAPLKTKGTSPRDALWTTVGVCTNSAAIFITDWDPVVEFIGRAPGPEIAVYLVAVLNRAVDGEIAGFKKSAEYRRRRTVSTRRQAVHDFTVALVARLRRRLKDMFASTISDERFEEARNVLCQRFPDRQSIKRPEKKVRFGNAAWAGVRAGDRVNLAHGVNGGTAVHQIGVEK